MTLILKKTFENLVLVLVSNTNMQHYQADTLINDISDHLMNYTFIPCTSLKRNNNPTPKPVKKRLINELNNLQILKLAYYTLTGLQPLGKLI